jgi:NADH-quinone oxidoreductase subunit E
MAWPVISREKSVVPLAGPSLLTEPVKAKIAGFFGRYETKRAALLPALHVIQETYGHVSYQAMKEVGDFLGLAPSEVFDTISYYSHFWTGPRGRKVIVVCRSLTCQVLGHESVLEAIKDYLGIDEHETTPDGQWSLMTEECLGACECGPCMLINERLHSKVRPQDVPRILGDPNCDREE